MKFDETQTHKNLMNAYNGESKASTKYRIYAAKAREEGYEQIGNIFDETSGNEKEHAEIWMKLLNGGEIPSTLDNLKESVSGEHYEWTKMYRAYADTARQEGYPQIADLFEGVTRIEHHHDKRYEKLIRDIETNTVFCKPEEHIWICLNCGNLIWGECAPGICPVCRYPQGYYQLCCENY